jgi:hypothetical protein
MKEGGWREGRERVPLSTYSSSRERHVAQLHDESRHKRPSKNRIGSCQSWADGGVNHKAASSLLLL